MSLFLVGMFVRTSLVLLDLDMTVLVSEAHELVLQVSDSLYLAIYVYLLFLGVALFDPLGLHNASLDRQRRSLT